MIWRVVWLSGLMLAARVAIAQNPPARDTTPRFDRPPMPVDTSPRGQPAGLQPPPPGLSRGLDPSPTDADPKHRFGRPIDFPLDSIAPPRAAPGVKDVLVDGRTGAILNATRRSLRFDPGDFVRVTVVNVNPILFNYAIAVGDTQVVTEASPADFFKLAFGIKLPSTGGAVAAGAPSLALLETKHDSAQAQANENTKLRAIRENVPPACKTQYLELGRLAFDAQWSALLIQSIIADVNDAQGQLNTGYGPLWLSLQDARLGAKRVRDLAYQADEILHRVERDMTEDQTELAAKVPAHAAVVDALMTKQRELDADKNCAGITSFKGEEAAAVRDTAVFSKALALSTTSTSNADKQRTLLDGIWSDETRFWKSVVLKRHNQGNDVIITVARQRIAETGADASTADAKAKTDTSANVTTTTTTTTLTATQVKPPPSTAQGKATAGKAPSKPPAAPPSSATPFDTIAQPVLHYVALGRFSIGAGFVYGALRAPQYGTVQRRSAAPPGASGDTLANVVTLTDNSGYRVIPSVTLSTLIWDWDNRYIDGMHVTLGAGVLPKSGDVTVDYLVGIGFGVFGSRLLVTPGIYIGRKNYLLAGVRLGDEISSSTPPTGSRYQAQFGLGLTYRLY